MNLYPADVHERRVAVVVDHLAERKLYPAPGVQRDHALNLVGQSRGLFRPGQGGIEHRTARVDDSRADVAVQIDLGT